MTLNVQVKRDCIEKVKASNVWDPRYNLPTVPMHNNPWIYMAYVALLLKQADERRAWRECSADLYEFARGCEIDMGLIDRWPDGGGGSCSHDEIMGAAYLSMPLAGRIVDRLKKENGRYDNKETDNDISDQEFRFIFLMPFLRACAGLKVGFFSQFMWCVHVLEHALTHKLGEESGTLKIWLMLDMMERFLICRWVGSFWQSRMRKHGLNGVKDCFKYYLNECPVLGEIATDRF